MQFWYPMVIPLLPLSLETSVSLKRNEYPKQIDVLMLYSEKVLEQQGNISGEQMTTIITDAIASTNEAFINSGIDMHFRLVHVAKVWINIDAMVWGRRGGGGACGTEERRSPVAAPRRIRTNASLINFKFLRNRLRPFAFILTSTTTRVWGRVRYS